MFSTSDTIVAIATPPGRGGIGVVRLSGPDAQRISRCLITHDRDLEPRQATFTRARLQGDTIDQILATYFPGPRSYTGDDVVELSAHGSPVVLRAIVAAAMSSGARLAEPGEFTLRAFLNGRIDLPQAEAVADLVEAVTPLQARAAFDQLQGTLTQTIGAIDESLLDLIARLEASVDFPEEGYHFVNPIELAGAIDAILERVTALVEQAERGRLVREGFQVAIVGKPNVGKSSLFNALLGASRAIVTDVPGTTRDLLTEVVELGGLRVTMVDSAGLRPSSDAIEQEGVLRARHAQTVSDVLLVVLDGADPLEEADLQILEETARARRVLVSNKADLERRWMEPAALAVSAKTLVGIDALRRQLIETLDVESFRERPEITNVRHADLMRQAQAALVRARSAAYSEDGSLSEEFVLADLQEARRSFEEISGRRTTDDVLALIFSRFCIGK
jgi:tRNA modification GTPase